MRPLERSKAPPKSSSHRRRILRCFSSRSAMSRGREGSASSPASAASWAFFASVAYFATLVKK